MQPTRTRWWPILKVVLGAIILFFIGRRFAHDLSQPQLYTEPITWGWLLPAGLLYFAGLSIACLYWGILLAQLGPSPASLPLARAYFLGQLGKYVPGKALTLVIRAGLAKHAGVSPGLAGLTAFYEVLITMASGGLLASLVSLIWSCNTVLRREDQPWSDAWYALFHLRAPEVGLSPHALLVVSLFLFALFFWAILPPVYNRLADRFSLPFREPTIRLPQLRLPHLGLGLVLGTVSWILLGLALACSLHAVPQAGLPWTFPTVARITAILAVAYVAGFVVLLAPGGLGVRELFLTWLLTPEIAALHTLPRELARGKVVLVVLLLRLVWTTLEVLLAGFLYCTQEKPS